MTNTTDQQAVTVAEEDREAAAQTVPDDGSHSSYMMVDAIMEGCGDDWPLVQAFARHRLASVSSASANEIERQDAQIAMGLIVDATTLEEAQSIAAAFLGGSQ